MDCYSFTDPEVSGWFTYSGHFTDKVVTLKMLQITLTTNT